MGLAGLLTGAGSFEEAVGLASSGDYANVSLRMRDVSGGDYTRMGIRGDIVVSLLGKV